MKDFIKAKIRESLITENRVKFDLDVPNDILELSKIFKIHNYSLMIVGGAVRDSLLKKPIKDYDLATDATPDQVEQMMAKAGFRTLPTGKSFGVINVFTDDDEYEIATFRSDESKGRHPSVKIGATIEMDAQRRDLRINALYYDINTNEIIDLVGGLEDLKNGTIQTVGNPQDRFEEDPLRILRFFRFLSRFGGEITKEIDLGLKKTINLLDKISPERIRDEFLKGIKTTKSVVHFLKLIDKYKLFDWVFKGLRVNKNIIEERDPAVLLAFLLRDNDPAVLGKVLKQLTYSAAETKAIAFLVVFQQFDNPEDVYLFKKQHMASGVTGEQLRKFGKLINFDQKILDAFADFKLSVTGDDAVRNMGVKPGPEMGLEIERREIAAFSSLC